MDLESLFLNFLPDLVGAGLGAYLGYRYGIRQERQIRKEEENELKKETINSLIEELDRNSMVLGDKMVMELKNTSERTVPVEVHPLTTSSYESAINSGRLSLLSPIDQVALSEYFENCKRIMNRVALVETKYQISNQEIKTYIDQINDIGESLVNHIIEIRGFLTSELSNIQG